MHIFTGQELIQIWEVGLKQHSLDRALTILLAAFPDTTRTTLAKLSIGQRDSCLLAVRQHTFGALLNSLATCPACSEQIEFTLDMHQMPITIDTYPNNSIYTLSVDTRMIQFRLPDSHDLATIVGSHDSVAARNMLLRRCVIQVEQGDKTLTVEELSETQILQLATQMKEYDPLAEIYIDLTCPTCSAAWQTLLDIESFLWTEISTQARRLLRTVHLLARTYGWRESDILAMSAARRQFYLEMVT
jgi:T4 bacteriophage base plate protein